MLLRLRRIFPFFASAAQPPRFLAPKICVACGVLKMFVPAARIDNYNNTSSQCGKPKWYFPLVNPFPSPENADVSVPRV